METSRKTKSVVTRKKTSHKMGHGDGNIATRKAKIALRKKK